MSNPFIEWLRSNNFPRIADYLENNFKGDK